MKHLKATSLALLALIPAGGTLAACGSSDTDTASSSAGGASAASAQTGTPPDMGTEVTGTAAAQAGDAATAKYEGTVERVVQQSDGSYVVHVVTDSGEQHVLVSAEFEVTGLQEMPAGGPPSGAAPGGTPPTTPGDAASIDSTTTATTS